MTITYRCNLGLTPTFSQERYVVYNVTLTLKNLDTDYHDGNYFCGMGDEWSSNSIRISVIGTIVLVMLIYTYCVYLCDMSVLE